MAWRLLGDGAARTVASDGWPRSATATPALRQHCHHQHRACKERPRTYFGSTRVGLPCISPARGKSLRHFTTLLALAAVPKPTGAWDCPKVSWEAVWKVMMAVLGFRRTHNGCECSKLMLHSLLWPPSDPGQHCPQACLYLRCSQNRLWVSLALVP